MAEEPFRFSPTGVNISPSSPRGTRFYVVDPANATVQLIVGRTRYGDVLFRATNGHHTVFETVYTPQLCERITSVSVSRARSWYLIALRRFGDGLDSREMSRSIFLDNSVEPPVEYPVSGKTAEPQIVAWAFDQESSLFLHRCYDGAVKIYQLIYDPSIPSFRTSLKRSMHVQISRTAFLGNPDHSAIWCYDSPNGQLFQTPDPSKFDLCPLPPTVDLSPNSEVRVFFTYPRRSLAPQICDQRVIIHASLCALSVILPAASLVLTEPIDYFDFSIPPGVAPIGSLDTPAEAIYRPVSRLPFAYYCHDFFLLAAPRDYVTAILLDHAGALRAAFRAQVPNTHVHALCALTRTGSRAIVRDSGEVISFSLNLAFFISQNPRWIVPLLHDAVRSSSFDFATVVNRAMLRVYWNGEVFNEMLLLEFNLQHRQMGLAEQCSTFAKRRFFMDGFRLFDRFDPPPPQQEPRIHSFRELEDRELRAPLFAKLVKLLDAPLFDARRFAVDTQFHAWLQLTAIRASILPPGAELRTDSSIFPPDYPLRITQTWAARNMLPVDHNWPVVEAGGLPLEGPRAGMAGRATRLWWFLRTHPASMVRSSGQSTGKMFAYVEQLTNKTSGGQIGPIVFSLHQYLMGLNFTEPIEEV
jgi:hypothetical protein